MGLIFDTEHEVHLVIDADVLKEEYFGCHPCVNTSSLRFRTEDLMNVLIPSFGIGYSLVEL
jgi:Ala-tRNA(Pro) deacylase